MIICDKYGTCCNWKYCDTKKDLDKEGCQCSHISEAKEVIHAKWIEDGCEDILACSNCGGECTYVEHFEETFDYDWDENPISMGYETSIEYLKTPYCQHCGASMDLE